MDERLAPGVEDGEEADLGAQVAGVGGYGAERLGDDPEEQTVDDGLVLGGDLGDRRRHGEDDVEVLGRQQVCPAPFEPCGAGQRLTGRTVAVAARVVPDAPMAAVVTLLDVSAEGGGAALLDGGHHAAVRRREGGPDLGPEGIAVAAEDLRRIGKDGGGVSVVVYRDKRGVEYESVRHLLTLSALLLEPISKSFKQYQQGCELHKAQEVVRIVLPARHNAALPLEPGEKALDLPPPRVAT